MPSLDFATFLGIVCAFSLMLIAIMTGSSLALFINFPAFMIVIGGTFGALMVHFPFRDVFNSMAVSKNAFLYRESTPREVIDVLIEYASRARKEGLLALESVTNEVQDAFLAKGLQMAADGHEPKVLEDTLNREIEYVEDRHEKGADIFAALGAYAPAMGMIGTLIGLIQMLKTLEDPTTIGPAMALALLTTLYGSVMANVIFLPMSGKLQIRSKSEVLKKTLILEGMKSILTGENPRVMEQKLHAFLAPRERESTFKR
ncbi:MAG: motility protein A [Desulfovermiculus sp.]